MTHLATSIGGVLNYFKINNAKGAGNLSRKAPSDGA